MNVTFNSRSVLHLSVLPSTKSWSIFFGIISVGVGASYYSPDEHLLMKIAYLSGCLILGLTFLDDWEDCVVDEVDKKITLTRKNWFEILTSKCTSDKTLVLDTSSILGVRVMPTKRKDRFKVALILRSGSVIPISETRSSCKSNEDNIADCIKNVLCLDRIQSVPHFFDDSDDDNQSVITVPDIESLDRSSYIRYNDVPKVENENECEVDNAADYFADDSSDTSSNSSADAEFFED